MKATFKQFLNESTVQAQATKIAATMLGSKNLHQADEKDVEKLENLLDVAKEEGRKYINSPMGTWIVSLFKASTKKFARVYPPKSSNASPMFYVAEATVVEILSILTEEMERQHASK